MRKSESPIDVDELRARVDVGALVPEVALPLEYLLGSRGKELRASLVQSAARVGSGYSASAVREGAAAIELLHLGTLAHDDVVDDGTMRRGRETVGMTYGNRAAAFAGGVLIAAAVQVVAEHGREANKAFAQTVMAICEGEMAEIEDLFNADRPLERYFQSIAGKTAAGFAFAGWIGSWLAGADRDSAARMRRFGHELGMAFQIHDDILDLTVPATRTGKPQGKDLQQGVYTLPVLYAAKRDPLVKRDLGRPLANGELESLVERVVASGGGEKAEEKCRFFAGKAKAVVADLPREVRESLLELLDAALEPLGLLSPSPYAQHV